MKKFNITLDKTSLVSFLSEAWDDIDKLSEEFDPILFVGHIDTASKQEKIKRVFANLCEEMAELADAVYEDHSNEHILDEYSDVFNFHLVLNKCLGNTKDKFITSFLDKFDKWKAVRNPNRLNSDFHVHLIHRWGMTMNLLKNRPWKNNQYPTDMEELDIRLHLANSAMACLIITSALRDDFPYSFKIKLDKNYGRIASNY